MSLSVIDIGSAAPQMSSRLRALRPAGCTWSHQNDQNASHSRGTVGDREARFLQKARPDVHVIDLAPKRQPVQRLLPGLRIAPGDPGERIRIE